MTDGPSKLNPDKLLEKARRATKDGRLHDAVSPMRAAVALAPERIDLRLGLTDVLSHLGDIDEALAENDKALEALDEERPLLFERARILQAGRRYPEAFKLFMDRMEAFKGDAAWRTACASMLLETKNYKAARVILDDALTMEPTRSDALVLRARLDDVTGNMSDALQRLEAAAQARPFDLLIRLNLAIFLANTPRIAEAVGHADVVLAVPADATTRRKAMMAKGSALLVTGRYEEGWRCFREKQIDNAQSASLRGLGSAAWWEPDGPAPYGHVVLAPNDGLGDEVIYASLIPAFHARYSEIANLTIIADHRLKGLFARSFPFAAIEAYEDDRARLKTLRDIPKRPNGDDFDMFVNFSDLPLLTDPKVRGAAKPAYLQPRKDLVDAWRLRVRIDDRPVLGVAWSSAIHRGDRSRYYPRIDEFIRVFDGVNARIVSIQYGDVTNAVAAMAERGVTIDVFDDADLFHDLETVAAIAANCDAVAGISNASSTIAAAVGVSFLMIAPSFAWSTLGQTKLPWWKDAPVFTSDRLGEWGDACAALNAALRRRFS